MKTILLAAGAAALVLSAGSAVAAGKGRTATVASPKQPIPYTQLEAYLAASPRERATRDWWSGAATGAGVSASATAPASPAPMTSAPMTPAPTPAPEDSAGAASAAGADASASTPPARDSAAPPIPGASPNAPTTVNPPASNRPSGDDTGPPASNTTPRR